MHKFYRKKPVIIQAVQLREDNYSEVCDFIETYGGPSLPPDWPELSEDDDVVFRLPTIHGDYTAFREGDWIFPEKKPGHFYPVKPDVFEETYEEVTPG